jgi:hypothetical protein
MALEQLSCDVYRTLKCVSKPATEQVRADLDDVTLAGGFRLPPTFREWARTFGYGEVGRLLNFFVPLVDPKHSEDLVRWSSEKHAFMLEMLDLGICEYEPDGSKGLARRLIPFGRSSNGHLFSWDPAAPTRDGEYAVYTFGSKMLAIYRAGDTFCEFLEGCFDSRAARILGPGYAPLERTFVPHVLHAAGTDR